MIYIDYRIGSKELLPYFRKGTAELTTLEFADAAFTGNGPDDCLWAIGIERKRISDLVNSMTSGRLAGHQLPGLYNSYHVYYLLIEGLWRPSPRDGSLEIYVHKKWMPLTLGSRRFMAKDIYKYINTLSILGGMKIAPVMSTPRESATWISSAYSWWNDKQFWEHSSIEQEYSSTVQFYTKKIPFLQRVAGELTGIGKGKAKAISLHYNSLWDFMFTDEKELRNIKGIGKELAESIIKEIHGGLEVKP